MKTLVYYLSLIYSVSYAGVVWSGVALVYLSFAF